MPPNLQLFENILGETVLDVPVAESHHRHGILHDTVAPEYLFGIVGNGEVFRLAEA